MPHPPKRREDIQEPFVRDKQIDPADYYPKGYHPELLETWPVSSDLVIPVDAMPPTMLQSMGEAYRVKQKNLEALQNTKK